jgi:hypothetical protein
MLKMLITITLLVISLSSQAESGFVVIASIESAIPKGAMLGRSQIIDLSSGASLTLLSAKGKIIQLKGPYTGSVDSDISEGDVDILRSISKLVRFSGNEDLSLAAFRNISSNDNSNFPEIWGVDIDASGQYCMRQELPLNLWWADAFKGAVMTLTNHKTLKQAKFRWPTKDQHTEWPADFVRQHDDSYSIKNNVANTETEFSLMTLPTAITGDMNRIVWMFEHDCQSQALRLLKEVIRPPEAS